NVGRPAVAAAPAGPHRGDPRSVYPKPAHHRANGVKGPEDQDTVAWRGVRPGHLTTRLDPSRESCFVAPPLHTLRQLLSSWAARAGQGAQYPVIDQRVENTRYGLRVLVAEYPDQGVGPTRAWNRHGTLAHVSGKDGRGRLVVGDIQYPLHRARAPRGR